MTRRIILPVLAAVIVASPALGMTVKLAWDRYPASAGIQGFELYYRPKGVPQYDFNNPIKKDISKSATEVTVEVPEDGFFVLRARTGSGKKSGASNQASTTAAETAEPGKNDRPKLPPRRPAGTGPDGRIAPTRPLRQ